LQAQADTPSRRVVARLNHFLPLLEQAIIQAARRVLDGEVVPATEKRLRLFAPHSQVIQRPTAGKDVGCGRKLWLEEVDGGIVSGDRLLDEAGQDEASLAESLAAPHRCFGHPPWRVTGDRGVASPANAKRASDASVTRVVLPSKDRRADQRVTLLLWVGPVSGLWGSRAGPLGRLGHRDHQPDQNRPNGGGPAGRLRRQSSITAWRHSTG
jgi:IS5 family transposase